MIVCWEKRKGGLGIKSLSTLNSFLGKMVLEICFRRRSFLEKRLLRESVERRGMVFAQSEGKI